MSETVLFEKDDKIQNIEAADKKNSPQIRVDQHLPTNSSPFECNICGKSFASKHYLRRHVSSLHLNQKFSCDQCDDSFSTKSNLNMHIKTVHLKQMIHSCEKCGVMVYFTARNTLSPLYTHVLRIY